MSLLDLSVQKAIDRAWDRDLARSSMERWLVLCEKNHWARCPHRLNLLASLFGASWYFTRLVFFRGRGIARLFDGDFHLDFTLSSLVDDFYQRCVGDQQEARFETLRIAKNEVMLSIFLAHLLGTHVQEDIERALTVLAEATLLCAIDILLGEDNPVKDNVAILAMGRMAGYEMNFGSDLDLIFLYRHGGRDLSDGIASFVRRLMQCLGLASPVGGLYEIDMRLRPHGSSGVLVTSARSFVDYHTGKRAIWERQIMTRCRAVFDRGQTAGSALSEIEPSVYQCYDNEALRLDIRSMRQMVVDELQTQRARYQIKKGEGGIMDIDFITHYLQLLNGYNHKSLRTASTRQALRRLSEAGLMSQSDRDILLRAYDYLKIIESHLRVFDMKPISAFSEDFTRFGALARSMSCSGDGTVTALLDHYKKTARSVRQIFERLTAA